MAKFQDEEVLLKQPRIKPALPEKPKVVPPPPQSPPHYLPAGARPSLLTSINQSLEGRMAPRVVFKDEKKESKKPLIQTTSKGKDKSEAKPIKGKDKAAKGSKEKLDEASSDQKQKKENGKDKRFSLVLSGAPKENTAELVPATPPPKVTPAKKKGFLGFRKSTKRNSYEVSADPIMDSPSSEIPRQLPLIPVPPDFDDSPPEPEVSAPKALLPNIPTKPDSGAAVEAAPSFTIPAFPDFTPPPAFIPDLPAPVPESETPLEIETPALHVSRPASQNETIQPPTGAVSTPPPSRVTPSPSPPEPETAAAEAASEAAVEMPPAPIIDPPSDLPSPKAERRISALSALERAEDMSPGKKIPCDQRIYEALEKARKKASPVSNPSTSITPPPEESPTVSLPELPPIDYEAGKSAEVNGFDHRQASPVLEGIAEEGCDPVPELLLVPPPLPKKLLPVPESLGPSPEKPDRPSSVDLSEYTYSPHLGDNEIPVPPEFSETDTTDILEFDDVTSDAHSQDLPVSDWGSGDYVGTDTPDGQISDFYSNGLISPGAEDGTDQDNPQPESSFSFPQESPAPPEVQAEVDNGVYESTENVYEEFSVSAKKKGKTEGGKKRKGPPKNPYAEAPQEANEEKVKTIRFGKGDKKSAAEGPDEKELKKKEKQRLEKEKKELKEKQEREKKEQREREKKENNMKKKFKITGQEEAMYEAKVTVTTKGRKDDLPVQSGDLISIIRTTNCPKGKWLARDSSNNYGYVAVDHMELDIKEMLELGKKAAHTRKISNTNAIEAEDTSIGNRASNHYPTSAESFTDDSEEWTGDEEEPLTPAAETADPLASVGHSRTLSMPDMGPEPVKEEALDPPEASSTQETDFDQTEMIILPPPDLYADVAQ
ncbi:FYN-binding protein [Collichthys lucidus]|uniref:FYN-binding protein n=1 Tax=Collichthys lucidus TaxID=240159 RepID=A0A4U5UKM9_COLLU|nr:FYN-binding protein [Collichthys lucidus]